MKNELHDFEYDDLTPLEKSTSIMRLKINDVVVGEGTMKEIANSLGRTVNSIAVGIHKTKMGISKFKKYTVELVDYIPYPKKIYEVYEYNRKLDSSVLIGCGTMEELSEITGYTEAYLRRLSSEKCLNYLDKMRKTDKRRNYEIYVIEVEDDE